MLGAPGHRAELLCELLGERPELDRLPLNSEPARVQSREIEQIGRELCQPRNLLLHRDQELPPRRLLQLLIRQELQKAPEREERRAQLMRGIRDEFTPRVVQLREANAHALERVG